MSCSSVDSEEFELEALVDSEVAHRQDNSEVKTGLEEAHRGWFNSGVDSLATKMDPMLYKEAMGDKENQMSWSSRLFSWINWSSKPNTELSKQKIGGKENEDNDEDVVHLMPYINDQQQLELQLTSHKNTVLHVAAQFARKGHLDIVKELIECAKRPGHEEVESGGGAAKEMLRATNKDNDTALHMAVRNRHSGVVELLTKEDPDFTHQPNNAEETPLYLAVERRYHDVLSIILTNCTSPAYGGPKGQTALHAAVLANIWITGKHDQSTKILLNRKPDLIKETDKDGWIPFHYAACLGDKDGVKLMLEIDKSVAYITTGEKGDEKTALHIAAANGRRQVMEKILSECPDCWEMVNSEGKNVLHIAVNEQEDRVIEYIFKMSWIIHLINQKDIKGNTPLHLLAMWELRRKLSHMIPQDISLSCDKVRILTLTAYDMFSHGMHRIYHNVEKHTFHLAMAMGRYPLCRSHTIM
ncbi:unnamed protein product [Camellia sinensis]